MNPQLPKNLADKLRKRQNEQALRELPAAATGIDFSSNDYLGFAGSATLHDKTRQLLQSRIPGTNGAGGSRLISGNHALYAECESYVAKFHEAPTALIFNSGYDANLGFFSSVPQRGDVILYDSLCHASIRDGIALSNAKSFKFAHNDNEQLEKLIGRHKTPLNEVYIATESVFSMDGDTPDLEPICALANASGCRIVVDEAHALGVFGDNGSGLVQLCGLQQQVFARIVTFGKALGCHGAAVLCQHDLKNYLVNFARSLIYTTALPPHSVAAILAGYQTLATSGHEINGLRDNIGHFNREKRLRDLGQLFIRSKSAIQSAVIPGNENARALEKSLKESGFDVRAILAPTVPEGQERLRICLHSFNSGPQITHLLDELARRIFY